MSKKTVISPLAAAVGTVFAVSLSHSSVTNATENPFSMQSVSGGSTLLAEGKCGEGKCGEGKCGSSMMKGGEGKCGLSMMDADGDGKITKEEFMQGHEVMFGKIDTNGDGAIDESERDTHMTKMMDMMKERPVSPGSPVKGEMAE
jgi:uncharacterized low-complexity protein